ncbi:class I SAM-dependent methyltransferase [Nonomuraea sp. NEAU-A123]|uniref:class I SAM-dependent methyltransferase n=1 Tax=Nonomuraea sp. NEAU-A123 TaxID=2839649 RepID=UPI001BE3D984|nr:class I SAM-dependent methyltransferase [Nonomuraea sp. NEAU-A123]MBT2231006.1 methyltransferase domain-containing protein [Nonomuraea sp. NEAU-A123]
MTRTDKGYKGIGMEGTVARWYANNTGKNLSRFAEQTRAVVARVPAGADVLEVAPGPGYLAIELARTGDYTVTGLDVSASFVQIARQKAAEAGVQIDFHHGNVSAMPFEDASFDFIVCCAAFKNFSDPVGALREMHRVLRPGGRAYINDLRRDVSKEAVDADVAHMRLGPMNRAITRYILRSVLPRQAYDKRQFAALISHTDFRTFDIQETPLSLDIELNK